MPVKSPCTGVCRMDAARQYCEGCGRTLEEIAGWSQMDEGQRLAVLALIARRREEGNLRVLPGEPPSGAN